MYIPQNLKNICLLLEKCGVRCLQWTPSRGQHAENNENKHFLSGGRNTNRRPQSGERLLTAHMERVLANTHHLSLHAKIRARSRPHGGGRGIVTSCRKPRPLNVLNGATGVTPLSLRATLLQLHMLQYVHVC